MKLLDPGIYGHVRAEDYHADCCAAPSLSASIATILIDRSPYHAWWHHPQLNPDFERENSRRLDLGTAAHSLLFEAGRDLVVLEGFTDFRTKAAQSAREAAYDAGKTPVLPSDYATASAMAEIARARILDRFGDTLATGRNEAVMIWREGEAWCRSMCDHLNADLTMNLDYKTTAGSAKPESAERSLYDLNYHFKAAFYERGLNVLDPGNVGRRRSYFLFQETDPPHECSLISPDEGGLTIARKQVAFAIEEWQRCMASGQWPGYSRHVHYAQIPPWIESRWIAREMGDDRITGALEPANLPQPPTTEITL